MDAFEEGNKALDKLKELEIEGALFEHQAAMTVQEQLKALGSVTGVKTKNLFLKVFCCMGKQARNKGRSKQIPSD